MTATMQKAFISLNSAAEFQALAAKIKAYDTETMEKFPPKRPGGGRSYPSDFPFVNPSPTNEERSAVETYRFMANPPERYTVYVNLRPQEEQAAITRRLHGEVLGTVTTWIGETLGHIWAAGPSHRGNIGGRQMPICFQGINGFRYYGRWAMDSGDCVSVSAAKPCKGWRWDLYATGWNDTEYGVRTYYDHGKRPSMFLGLKSGVAAELEPLEEWAYRMAVIADKKIAENPADSYASGARACVAYWQATGETVRREA